MFTKVVEHCLIDQRHEVPGIQELVAIKLYRTLKRPCIGMVLTWAVNQNPRFWW
jgi:hypothetical protein